MGNYFKSFADPHPDIRRRKIHCREIRNGNAAGLLARHFPSSLTPLVAGSRGIGIPRWNFLSPLGFIKTFGFAMDFFQFYHRAWFFFF